MIRTMPCRITRFFLRENGFASVWVNPQVEFIYPKFFKMFSLFQSAKKTNQKSPLQKRILAQMERELVLFQASDWAFMIHNNSAGGYAKNRLAEHERDFMKLLSLFQGVFQDESLLNEIELRDNIFPWLNR